MIVTLVAPTKMESFNEGVTIYLVIVSEGAERGGTGKKVLNVEGEILSLTSFFVEEDNRRSQW